MKNNFSFQADSEIVKKTYEELDNYEIIYKDNKENNGQVVIYFSSNGLYYPNTEKEFENKIIKQDRYEWKKNLIKNVGKHIFIRDIQKQWYIEGINKEFNTIEKILDFLKNETKGYKVTTMGSSAGGFAAVLFGILLNADRIYSFNGQFDISYRLKDSNDIVDPLLFKNKSKDQYNKWYNLEMYIKQYKGDIYYFASKYSEVDRLQIEVAAKHSNIITILFNSKEHGIPFFPYLFNYIFQLNKIDLKKLSENNWNKYSISIRLIGSFRTICLLSKYYGRKLLKKIKEKL
jgi:hypothetical protein